MARIFSHTPNTVDMAANTMNRKNKEFPLEKSSRAHVLPIPEKEITWLELCNLIKAEDPSPFPALSQIEVYGRVKR